MAQLQTRFDELQNSYVFRQVNEKSADFQRRNPDKTIYKMGVGNTTQPLSPTITAALHDAVENLSKQSTYTGYGDELGDENLRSALASYYQSAFNVNMTADEFILSDGAKSDTANLPSIFMGGTTAVQNPVYPVYVESNILAGNKITYLPCNEANNFVPDVPQEKVDLLYVCSPNNPTGTAATKEQLQSLVNYARTNNAVIVYDAAYAAFVRDPSLPRSIYEIEGAKECAIEVGSFSKWAGFSGVRLAWTIVPSELIVENSKPGEVLARWRRRQLVYFNGPSNIAQAGGLAVLSESGLKECDEIVSYYLANAKIIRQSLTNSGLTVYGGEHSPYVWAKTPTGLSSWEFFDLLLEQTQVIVTPGVGFGSEGEGYVRFSAFSSRDTTEKAMQRVASHLNQLPV